MSKSIIDYLKEVPDPRGAQGSRDEGMHRLIYQSSRLGYFLYLGFMVLTQYKVQLTDFNVTQPDILKCLYFMMY